MNKGYKGLYEHVMMMPQNEVDKLLSSLVEREIIAKKIMNLPNMMQAGGLQNCMKMKSN